MTRQLITDEWLLSLESLPLGLAIETVRGAGYRPEAIPETVACPPYLGHDVIILRHTEGPSPHVTGARAGDPAQIER